MTKVLLMRDRDRTRYDNREHTKAVLMTGIACAQRCRADSMVECTLVLDYLLYYCLPLLLLTFTLAYVGLCSLLSKLSSVDISHSSVKDPCKSGT